MLKLMQFTKARISGDLRKYAQKHTDKDKKARFRSIKHAKHNQELTGK